MCILTPSILPLVISRKWVHQESDSARHVNTNISTISTKLFGNRSNIPEISLVENVTKTVELKGAHTKFEPCP
jgi:hypothetical protein